MDRHPPSSALRYMRSILLVDLVAALVTAAACWLGRWRSLYAFGNGLMLAGVVVMGFGVSSVFGGVSIAGDSNYRIAQSVMPNSLNDRTRQIMLDLAASTSFSILAGVSGLGLIVAGFIVAAAFPPTLG